MLLQAYRIRTTLCACKVRHPKQEVSGLFKGAELSLEADSLDINDPGRSLAGIVHFGYRSDTSIMAFRRIVAESPLHPTF